MTRKEDIQEQTIAEIRKRFGAGAIFWGDDKPVESVKTVSTGSIGLDAAMGIGGLGRGKITEIFGAESTGKTTITLQSIANAQREGLAGFMDMENALDRAYATALGVDFEKLALAQPQTGEQCLEIADALIRGGAVIVVIDSVPALIPQSRLEGDFADKNYGDVAHLLSRSLPRLKASAAQFGCALVFTNQLRVDQKGYIPKGMTNYTPMKTYGGEALKYYSDIRISLKRKFDKETKEEEQIVTATVAKNKLAPPFKTAEFAIVYGKGVDHAAELTSVAVEREIIKRNGAWYSYKELKLQGLDAVVQSLRENTELKNEIEKRVMERR